MQITIMRTHHTTARQTMTLVTVLLAVLLALAGCGTPKAAPQQPRPAPKPTVTVVFPADFVNPILYSKSDRTPKAVAKEFKSLGRKYCTDAHARKDGSVEATLTKKQQRNIIRFYQDGINTAVKDLHGNSPDYHYTLNPDLTELDAWVDSRLNPFGGSAITIFTPIYSGYIYYLKGGTGHWDMTIKLYNCHDNQLKQQFTYRQKLSLNYASLGN